MNLTPQEIQHRVIEAFKQKDQVYEVKAEEPTTGEMLTEAHAAFESAEEQERATLIKSAQEIAQRKKLSVAARQKIKQALFGDPDIDILKLDLAALHTLVRHLEAAK